MNKAAAGIKETNPHFKKAHAVMSEQNDDRDFAGHDDAKMAIRAAVRYLLKGVPVSDRANIVSEIIETVHQVVHEVTADSSDPFEDELPGG